MTEQFFNLTINTDEDIIFQSDNGDISLICVLDIELDSESKWYCLTYPEKDNFVHEFFEGNPKIALSRAKEVQNRLT